MKKSPVMRAGCGLNNIGKNRTYGNGNNPVEQRDLGNRTEADHEIGVYEKNHYPDCEVYSSSHRNVQLADAG